MTEVLHRVPLFATLSDKAVGRLMRESNVRVMSSGEVVAVEGEPATHVIVVEAGTLTAVRTTAAGRRLRLGEFAGPCAVDKAAVLDGGGHTATWVASTQARLRLVPGRLLLAMIDDLPAVRRHVLSTLAGQIRQQHAWQQSGDTTTRVAGWLVDRAARDGTRIVLPGAQQGLADALGVTRVTVNRALASLARDGLIRTEPGAVTILAPELLTHRAQA